MWFVILCKLNFFSVSFSWVHHTFFHHHQPLFFELPFLCHFIYNFNVYFSFLSKLSFPSFSNLYPHLQCVQACFLRTVCVMHAADLEPYFISRKYCNLYHVSAICKHNNYCFTLKAYPVKLTHILVNADIR